MKKSFYGVIAAIITVVSFPAFALSLNEARSSGMVGEKADGYVMAISKSQEAADLAKDVNSKRKAAYASISRDNGQPVSIVAKLAAQKIINKLPAGAKYQDGAGNWKQK